MKWMLAALFVAAPALAQEVTLTYQGELTDLADAPFEGTQTLFFRLYDADAGGQELWAERQDDVPVVAGRFVAILGDQQPLPRDLPPGGLWLGVQAEGDVEFEPRLQVGGALKAQWAAVAAQALDVAGRHIHPEPREHRRAGRHRRPGRWVGPVEGFGGVGPLGSAGRGRAAWAAGPQGAQGDVGPRGLQGHPPGRGAGRRAGPAR
ncbi:MAG: hypothetical protein H6706_07580 [Myxococcales bacterium]|nr:hypothetical protein [Myxococcales bacterium]